MWIGIIKKLLLGFFIVTHIISCGAVSSSELNDTEKAMIYLMLSQTHEVKIHQMRGAVENQVFLHPDGHREAVYDANGKLVQDGINDGSYNYAHPEKNPFGHYDQDIHPWILMGNSPNDPTSKEERIYAYMLDLEGGIVRAQAMWPQMSIESLIKTQGQSKFPKHWRKVLQHPESKSLLELISGEIEITDDNLISTLKSLNSTFEKVY